MFTKCPIRCDLLTPLACRFKFAHAQGLRAAYSPKRMMLDIPRTRPRSMQPRLYRHIEALQHRELYFIVSNYPTIYSIEVPYML
jgi:hypothetical protein